MGAKVSDSNKVKHFVHEYRNFFDGYFLSAQDFPDLLKIFPSYSKALVGWVHHNVVLVCDRKSRAHGL
jgi:hypothetical protein